MIKSSVANRLRWALDQCPLPPSDHVQVAGEARAGLPSLFHTRWYAAGHYLPNTWQVKPDGYEIKVVESRFLSWRRSFTLSAPCEEVAARPALITIDEWIPAYEPRPLPGWRCFGRHYTAAYAWLHPDYVNDWHNHAKRHLKQFQKTDCELRLGTRDDVAKLYANSQVPKNLRQSLLKILDRQLQVQPDTIDILVAEKDQQPIACLVSGQCVEAKLSEYIIGAFHPDYKKDNPMVGLVNWWYQRSLAQGLTRLTFGHIEAPGPWWWPASSSFGYSFFKTHFGISRIWFPKQRWRIRLNLSVKQVKK